MALTAQQQADAIFYLGYPGTTIVPGTTNFNNIVFDRLNNTSTFIDAQAGALLDRIAAIDVQLQAAPARMITTEVGDIKLNQDEAIRVRKERNVLIRTLGQLLDVPAALGGGNKSVMV